MKSLKIYIKIIIAFIVFSSSLFAQVTQEWVSFYNGPINDEDLAFSIAVDGSGNVYVTGLSWGATERDFATVKYNSSGVQQWFQRYDGPGNEQDEAYAIAVDGSGNVYVTGRSRSGSTSETEDYATIKYNTAGVQMWLQRYNGPGNGQDWPYSIAIDGSGNVYVAGWSTGAGTNLDYAIVKYNSTGVQQWAQRYDGPANNIDQAISLAVDNSGNVYVTGRSNGSGMGDYATIKYNSSGVQQWLQRYNGPGNQDDLALSIAFDNSGNVYVTGGSTGSGTGSDYTTIKYNSSGVQQWLQRYNSQSSINDVGSSIKVDGSGNVFVTGQCEVSSTERDYTTISYNSSGVQRWIQTYNGPKDPADWGWQPSLAIDNSGCAYVAAYSRGGGTAIDFATIKYNTSGVQQWVKTYNGPGDGFDGIRSIAIDGSNNVYVTGASFRSTTDYDYSTIKYSQQIGIQNISTEIPNLFSMSQNYPNPFNPNTQVRFDIQKRSDVKIVIFDILGREITTLVNEQIGAGVYEIDWNASNYPSGVYFYKLTAGDYTDTKKMVLLK